MKSLATRMFDATVRIEEMFWIPGLQSSVPTEFKDFIRNDLEDAKELRAQLPWLETFLKFELEPDEWPAEFYRKDCNGYLVNLARPIPHDFSKDGKSHEYSWGYYQCRWVYFETLDAIADYAEQFSKEIVERERNKKPKKPRAA